MRTFVGAKIHGITVTSAQLEYHGSVTIDNHLMDVANIMPYEQVHVVNLNTGQRWITYAIPGRPGAFELNGGGARCGCVGDRCVVMTYIQADKTPGAEVIELDTNNKIKFSFTYPMAEQ